MPSKFEIRYGDPFQPFWRITLAWINGDDQRPYLNRQEKDLLPLVASDEPVHDAATE